MAKKKSVKSGAKTNAMQIESVALQYSSRDLIILFFGILILIALAYIVIKYDIVSHEEFILGAQKYNATIGKLNETLTTSPSTIEIAVVLNTIVPIISNVYGGDL